MICDGSKCPRNSFFESAPETDFNAAGSKYSFEFLFARLAALLVGAAEIPCRFWRNRTVGVWDGVWVLDECCC